jgi:class 3 adenylate cyclase
MSDDILAVLDAVGSERATLIGEGPGGGPMAMFLAATYPDRTDALILFNTVARWLQSEDYPFGLRPEDLGPILEMIEAQWGTDEMVASFAPSRADDRSFQEWHARYERLAAKPKTSRAFMDWGFHLDLRDTLQHIRVPTMVVHMRDNPVYPLEFGEYLSDHIRDAQLVALPGTDIALYGGQSLEIVDQIEEFITGAPPVAEPDRVLATVVFTDIVSSTESASRLGDKGWVGILDEHDALLSRELQRFRGRKVNSTGDGMLAVFDAPGRAVRCALAICAGVRSLGIEIRAGVHTGEVELRGQDIGGIAVHIGSRVAAVAGPEEILVSRTVVDLISGSGIELADRGEHELKGVPGTWHLFAVKT